MASQPRALVLAPVSSRHDAEGDDSTLAIMSLWSVVGLALSIACIRFDHAFVTALRLLG